MQLFVAPDVSISALLRKIGNYSGLALSRNNIRPGINHGKSPAQTQLLKIYSDIRDSPHHVLQMILHN